MHLSSVLVTQTTGAPSARPVGPIRRPFRQHDDAGHHHFASPPPTPPARPFTSQAWQDASPFGDSFFAFLPYASGGGLIPCRRNIRLAQRRPLIG